MSEQIELLKRTSIVQNKAQRQNCDSSTEKKIDSGSGIDKAHCERQSSNATAQYSKLGRMNIAHHLRSQD